MEAGPLGRQHTAVEAQERLVNSAVRLQAEHFLGRHPQGQRRAVAHDPADQVQGPPLLRLLQG